MRPPAQYAAEDVRFLCSPWVGGCDIHAYLGPVHSIVRLSAYPIADRSERIEAGIHEAFEQPSGAAAKLNANAVASWTLVLDPFVGETIQISVQGSAFDIRPYVRPTFSFSFDLDGIIQEVQP